MADVDQILTLVRGHCIKKEENKMRKLILFIVISLTACASIDQQVLVEPAEPVENEQFFMNLDAELSQSKDVMKTLEVFGKYFTSYIPGDERLDIHRGFDPFENDSYGHVKPCTEPRSREVTPLLTQDIRFDCVYEHSTTDECILYRRKTRPSMLCYFNYLKYLPENSEIKSELDFLRLYSAYLDFPVSKDYKRIRADYESMERTSHEKEIFKERLKNQDRERMESLVNSTWFMERCEKDFNKTKSSNFDSYWRTTDFSKFKATKKFKRCLCFWNYASDTDWINKQKNKRYGDMEFTSFIRNMCDEYRKIND